MGDVANYFGEGLRSKKYCYKNVYGIFVVNRKSEWRDETSDMGSGGSQYIYCGRRIPECLATQRGWRDGLSERQK